jgi:hypothetical protein
MKNVVQIEHSASSSRSKHEGESSFALCDRLSQTRDNSQRQLPTDQDYAVSTREYQTDQSSLKTAPAAARSVLEKRRKQRQQQTHRSRRLTRSLHIRAMRLSSRSDRGLCQMDEKPAIRTIATADWQMDNLLTLSPCANFRVSAQPRTPQRSQCGVEKRPALPLSLF